MAKLQDVLQAIDDYNRQDPHQKEFPYSERLTRWVRHLNPAPSEALQIAARGQHIGRWTSPRTDYPMDRPGYLRWRQKLKEFHAQTVSDIMSRLGYSSEQIEPVRTIILKKKLTDPDTQTIEDALCLVFLETQFEELRQKTPDAKMIDIVQKTWRKMSSRGKEVALSLDLPGPHLAIIQSAVQPG